MLNKTFMHYCWFENKPVTSNFLLMKPMCMSRIMKKVKYPHTCIFPTG